MCEPTTLAVLTIAGSAVAASAPAVSAYMKSESIKEEGEFQLGQSRRNAALADEAAVDAESRGQFQSSDAIGRGETTAAKAKEEAGRMQGAQVAAMASSGLDVQSHSYSQIVSGGAAQAELDQLAIRNDAAREAWGFRENARREGSQYRKQAEQMRIEGARAHQRAKTEARNTLIGGALQTVGGLAKLGGASGAV